MGRQRKFSAHIKWTDEEKHLLTELYATASREKLTEAFPFRSLSSIEAKANALGLSKTKKARTIDEVRKAKRESMARKRASNPDAMRKYQLSYYRSNREQQLKAMKQYQHRRFFWLRATKLKSKVSATDLAKLWKSQRGKCAMTGRKLNRENAHLDHIIAKARGGSDEISNLRWLCKEANLARRDLSDNEFLKLCEDVMRWMMFAPAGK